MPMWVADQASSAIEINLVGAALSGLILAEGRNIHVAFEPLVPDFGFARPEVMVEFGSCSTGGPREERQREDDAVTYVPGIAYLSARLSIVGPADVLEKATSVYVLCCQQRAHGNVSPAVGTTSLDWTTQDTRIRRCQTASWDYQ